MLAVVVRAALVDIAPTVFPQTGRVSEGGSLRAIANASGWYQVARHRSGARYA